MDNLRYNPKVLYSKLVIKSLCHFLVKAMACRFKNFVLLSGLLSEQSSNKIANITPPTIQQPRLPNFGRHGGSMVVRQTVVLQSRVRIRCLPSPQLIPLSWWVTIWDGTWPRADLCEGHQRKKLCKMDRWFATKNIEEKKNCKYQNGVNKRGNYYWILTSRLPNLNRGCGDN